MNKPYEFGSLQAVREELNQYVDLVQHLMSLTKQRRTNSSKQEFDNDTFVEKARGDCDIRVGLGCHNATTPVVPGMFIFLVRIFGFLNCNICKMQERYKCIIILCIEL